MMNDKWTRRRVAHAVSVALAGLSTGAFAQDAAEGAYNGDAEVLETVVVTAQKREQNLQDVPVTVTAISAQLLRDSGVRDIKDLTILTPGLLVTSSSNEASTTARIRGIGTVGDNIGLESSVGVVIDGVYRPRNGVGFGDLGELERIEVLKGPQGTLFGKNTSAGVVNVITKRPQFDFGTDVALTGASLGTLDATGSLTGPIVENKLAGRINVTSHKRDGFYDVNTGDGTRTETEDSNRDEIAARGQLLFLPTASVSALFIADYAHRDESCCAAVQINNGPTTPFIDAVATADSGVAQPADPFARVAYLDRPTGQEITDKGVSTELAIDTSFGKVTSITAWRGYEAATGQDSDFTTADIVWRNADGNSNEFSQLSEELRFSGQSARVDWMVGAFYAAEGLDSDVNVSYGADFENYYSLALSQGTAPTLVNTLTGLPAQAAYGMGEGAQDRFEQRSDSFAVFTHNSVRLTENLNATVGVRYTQETKDLDSAYSNTDGGVGCDTSRARYPVVSAVLPAAAVPVWYAFGCSASFDPIYNDRTTSQSIDEDDVSGTLKLAYSFTPDLMSYVSYARGYKASGFNLERERNAVPSSGAPMYTFDADTSFAPETVDSYELGAKFQTAGHRFRMNTALFYQNFQDFQLNTFTGLAFVVESIPEVLSQGVDIDFDVAPLEGLVFNAGVTYAQTEYGDFTPPFASLARLPNAQMAFAPEWSGSLAATYEHSLGSTWMWRANVGAKYTSEYNTGSDLNPAKLQDALTLVNARFAVGTQDKRWMVEAWAQNLTGAEYYQVVFDATLQTGTYDASLGAPRTYGVTARFSF